MASDIYSRLHSIKEDTQFVLTVAKQYPHYPLFANQRCGAWYADPTRARPEFVYFKSTDGHYGIWDFNLRRANLHLLPIIQASKGMLLVDSTRRGKSIPDALSKTIPLWCAVINGAQAQRRNRNRIAITTVIPERETLYNEDAWEEYGKRIFIPPDVISESERAQMEERLPELVNKFLASSFFSHMPDLQWPLRPLWITPQSSNTPSLNHSSSRVDQSTTPLANVQMNQSFYPVICISASKTGTTDTEQTRVEHLDCNYVQGSGDDHESWSMGLTPDLFWTYHDQLLTCGKEKLEDLVRQIVAIRATNDQHSSVPNPSPALDQARSHSVSPIKIVNGRISFASSNLSMLPSEQRYAAIIQVCPCRGSPQSRTKIEICRGNETRLVITSMGAKRGQMDFLRVILPAVDKFASTWLSQDDRHHDQNGTSVEPESSLLVVDETGEYDEAIGIVVLLLGRFFTEEGKRLSIQETNNVSKESLRKRLEWVQQSIPRANPSRTTMKRVNEYAIPGKSKIQRQRPTIKSDL